MQVIVNITKKELVRILMIAALISVMVGGVYSFKIFVKHTYGTGPIEASEFSQVDASSGLGCIRPSFGLKARCKMAGGNLEVIEGSFVFLFGCYPPGQASDSGKSCKEDSDCEGVCFHQDPNGLYLDGEANNKCTDYKKPYFEYESSSPQGRLCQDEVWPAWLKFWNK